METPLTSVYRTALLRRESFGGTLFCPETGKRTYINEVEFSTVKASKRMVASLASEIGWGANSVRITEPSLLPTNNFSAPDTVFLEVTRACNLACSHCFNDSGKAMVGQLRQRQLEQIVQDLADSGVQEIRFTGGEPMAFRGTVNLIALASSLGLRCSMGTNAVLITSQVAVKLSRAGLHAGIVSLDGLEHRHDQIRGHYSYRKTWDGLEQLQAEGIRVRVNVVVMRSNLGDIVPLVEYLAKRDIPVFLRRLILSGRAESSANQMLTVAEYDELRRGLLHLLDDPRSLVDGHYLGTARVVPRIQLPFERRGCSAGQRGLVVLSNGTVQTCGFLGPLGEKSIGQLPNEPLLRVWARLNESGHIRTLEENLGPYNASTTGPATNCLAIAQTGSEQQLVQISFGRNTK